MDEYESLNHTQWECLYHVVFIPKCRRRRLYVELRKYLGEVFRRLAEQKESRVEEGHLMPDPGFAAKIRTIGQICPATPRPLANWLPSDLLQLFGYRSDLQVYLV